ncbi:MAG TPA: helix-turn-helix transcriptional regulator [Phenylobacterium sp.]|nr:helix-turn-helix transcriptional regulator [Phenylobacterium sp.]
MNVLSPPPLTERQALLSQILKGIRRRRGLRSSEVARQMGMALRSYQHFESARGREDAPTIHAFAEAVDADGYAILLALDMKAPDFALDCLDNKFASVMVLAARRFRKGSGRNLARLDPRSVIAAFERAFAELTRKLNEDDGYVEAWMTEPALGDDSGADDPDDDPEDR